jgi:hypothetical protein
MMGSTTLFDIGNAQRLEIVIVRVLVRSARVLAVSRGELTTAILVREVPLGIVLSVPAEKVISGIVLLGAIFSRVHRSIWTQPLI